MSLSYSFSNLAPSIEISLTYTRMSIDPTLNYLIQSFIETKFTSSIGVQTGARKEALLDLTLERYVRTV